MRSAIASPDDPHGAVCSLRPLPGRFGGGDQRGGELLVEGEEVFDAVVVAEEWFGPVTAIHGAVESLMRFQQRSRHHQWVIENIRDSEVDP